MNTIIEAKNVGKKYNILHEQGRYLSLRDVIMNVIQEPFKFLKTKVKQVSGIEKKEEYWALQDINFTINKGEVIGIIGPNGAGKSTLLKILSQITPPTTGIIKITGKVGSLLEVGTGFHPELTGRENIFLNGAILGMSKKEIINKFDQIVEFAGVSKFLDTPVKHYSSGMYVRLAFSVAAHMEPDILIIDEVLAVGDIEFQKKCLGKMNQITKQEGRTIIFVSHNFEAIQELCTRTILLKNGKIDKIGPTNEILNEYYNSIFTVNGGNVEVSEKLNSDGTFVGIKMLNSDNVISNIIRQNEDFYIEIGLNIKKEIIGAEVSVSIRNSKGVDIVFSSLSDSTNGQLVNLPKGKYNYKIKFNGGFLLPDRYLIRTSLHNPGYTNIDTRENVMNFKIQDLGGRRAVNYGIGCVSIPNKWTKYEQSK